MSPDTAVAVAIRPALTLLPSRMDSPEAVALLLAIGGQESRFEHREQIRGPARGFYQFESAGIAGVLRHHASAQLSSEVCETLHYPATVEAVHAAVRDNDVLATVFARLLLWTHPAALPGRADADGAWAYYLALWRPGKPHAKTWPTYHALAWRQIDNLKET